MDIRLDDQVAVITGGSRGIGAATVRLFADCGANVVFGYRHAAEAAQQVVRSSVGGDRVIAVPGDVSKMKDAKKLVGEAVRRFGRVDVLVANAGIWPAARTPIERMSEKEWDRMIAVNLRGVYTVIRQTVPGMIKRQRGRIIVVSSTAGQRGEVFHSHYGAAKGALISLVKGLAAELAPHQILVTCVAPGWADTDMARPVLEDPAEARKILAAIPLGRAGRAEEVAAAILFLASEMASYITGEVLNVNGGSVLCG